MSQYKIFETDTYIKRLNKQEGKNRIIIEKKLNEKVYPQLKKEPHYGPNIKKLKNYNPDTWRYRIGNYRIFYEIEDTIRIVSITSIQSRKDAY